MEAQLKENIEICASHDGEDSSYDTEGELDEVVGKGRRCDSAKLNKNQDHEHVSRTSSDTLGQEFAEYVTDISSSPGTLSPNQINSTSILTQKFPGNTLLLSLDNASDCSPDYTSRLEFALKLGYTERLVQAALFRLGPDPAQNELLAELIKLGAQCHSKADFVCESPISDFLASSSPVIIANVLHSGIKSDAQHIFHNQRKTSQTRVIAKNTISKTGASQPDETNQHVSLRPVVIDGSNVAISHGNKELFSCRGIKLCVDWFKSRGHKDITVFVPKWRKENSRPDNLIKEQEILHELERERILVFTPSRLVCGKRMVCYDDRYILKLAVENDGIVVSNDNYRDLIQESSEFKKVVEERVLMFSFVNDRFMPPDDPLGRSGPTLDNFLRNQPRKANSPPSCPYGKKCTYGNKCKFHHPERGFGPHKSITERLSEHAARHILARHQASEPNRTESYLSVPLNVNKGIPSDSVTGSKQLNENLSRKRLCRTGTSAPEGDCLHALQSQDQQSNMKAQFKMFYNNQSGRALSFQKAHSIENISRDAYSHICSSNQNIQSATETPSVSQSPDEPVNLHRKLCRQLTLNAPGSDLRINQLQRCMSFAGTCTLNSSASANLITPAQCNHRPLAPSRSGPRSLHPIQINRHQNVTRIASAPTASRPWRSGQSSQSSSEPHINLWPHHTSSKFLAAQDQRRRLHYHLASIFPEEHVERVMQLYPDETHPQTICAAILTMFPEI